MTNMQVRSTHMVGSNSVARLRLRGIKPRCQARGGEGTHCALHLPTQARCSSSAFEPPVVLHGPNAFRPKRIQLARLFPISEYVQQEGSESIRRSMHA